ncbi:MAG: hypothetical protein RIS19_656, partial [Actinomycetota bacterium]
MDEVQKENSPKRSRRVTAGPATDAPVEAKKPARSRKSEDAAPAAAPAASTDAPAERSNTRTRNRSAAPSDSAPKAEGSQESTSERPARGEFDGERPERSERNERQGQNRNRNRNRNRNGGNDRFRDRGPRRNNERDEVDTEISPDDVLVPVAGILDILDNYAFVRTTGYLAGPNDVYVSLGQVKKYSLRKGDAVVGAIRQPREGDSPSRTKFNAIVRVDSVNGQTPEE